MSRIDGPPGIPARKTVGVPQSAQNEVQTLSYASTVAASGNATLTVPKPDGSTCTTGNIAFNATVPTIIAAINAAAGAIFVQGAV